MSRSLTSAVITESAKPAVAPVWFIYLDISGDPVWIWSGSHDVTVTVASDPLLSTPRTFFGVHYVGKLGDQVQDAEGSIQKVTFAVNSADFAVDDMLMDFIGAPLTWMLRPAVIWFGFYNEQAGTVVASPFRVMTGRMDNVHVVDGPDGGLSLDIISRKADGKRANGWRLSDTHQKRLFSSDRALEYVPFLVNMDMKFGVAGAFSINMNGSNSSYPRLLDGRGRGGFAEF